MDGTQIKERVRIRLLGSALGELQRASGPERRLRVRQEVLTVLREERAILPATVVTDMVNQVSDEVVFEVWRQRSIDARRSIATVTGWATRRALHDNDWNSVCTKAADDAQAVESRADDNCGCRICAAHASSPTRDT